MSPHITFTAPDGNYFTDPDPKWLAELITKADDSYWAQGSGDAGLQFRLDGTPYAEMILVIRASFGAMVHHLYAAEGIEYVMSEPELGEEEITIQHGGNPWALPRAYFVRPSNAADAVRAFLEDGRRLQGGRWVEF